MTVADLVEGLEAYQDAKCELDNFENSYQDVNRLESRMKEAEQKIKTAIREICDETSNS